MPMKTVLSMLTIVVSLILAPFIDIPLPMGKSRKS